MEALAQRCVRVVAVRAGEQALVVQEEVVLCAGGRGAVLRRAEASDAVGAAWLAEVGHSGRNELAWGTRCGTSGRLHVLVVKGRAVVLADRARSKSSSKAGTASNIASIAVVASRVAPKAVWTRQQTLI